MTRWTRLNPSNELVSAHQVPITVPSSAGLEYCVNKSTISRLRFRRLRHMATVTSAPRLLKARIIVRPTRPQLLLLLQQQEGEEKMEMEEEEESVSKE